MTLLVTPEIIARIGNKWYSAVNKPYVTSILRSLVMCMNYEGYGAIYDMMRACDHKEEEAIATRFLRTGQHVARDHREQVAAIVARLFLQTDDLEMEHIKQSVFGVASEAPIMAVDHPALQELFKTQTGVLYLALQCIWPSLDSQCTRSCRQMRNSPEFCSRLPHLNKNGRSQCWAT